MLDVHRAAHFLSISVWAMRALGWSGQVPEVRVGKLVRYDVRDLDRYIEVNKRRERRP